MPQSYIFRMVAMDFRRMISEGPIEIDPDVKNGLTSEDSQRLLSVKSSLHKYSRFTDMLPQDEMNEKLQEEERRNEVSKTSYSLFAALETIGFFVREASCASSNHESPRMSSNHEALRASLSRETPR